MDPIKNLLVGLDLTEMDNTLIRYTAFLCTQPSIEKVYFVHVRKHTDLPEEVMKGAAHNWQSEAGEIQEKIGQMVEEHFARVPLVQTEIHLIEGSPLKEMLLWSRQHNIDMFLVGRKLRLRGSGVLSQKLLRSGRISVLFVPETAEPKLDRIVVSIDFSDYSMMALDQMLHSALARPNVEITCLHVYQVPTGYITLGISYEEFDARMRHFAEDKFNYVIERFPELGQRAQLRLVKQEHQDDIAELIVLEAKRCRADMLVIGAKGKSAAALFVLGSVTEKLLAEDTDIPLVVFKKKNEEIGFLDALIG